MANKLLIPNTCQVPNALFDQVMPKVSHAEFKVIMAIVRKTYGWGKVSDRISLSQLTKTTKVSKQKVLDSIKSLDWLITAFKLPNGTTEYSINIDAETGLLSGQLEEENCLLSGQGSLASGQVASLLSGHTKPILKPTIQNPEEGDVGAISALAVDADPQAKALPTNPPDPDSKTPEWPSPEALVKLYNKEAADELAAVTRLSPARRKKAHKYLKEFSDEAFWREVFAETKRSKFLRGLRNGPGHEGFKGDFDWLLTKGKDQTENCVKVFEGRYRD